MFDVEVVPEVFPVIVTVFPQILPANVAPNCDVALTAFPLWINVAV
jgi:hypothetical protein